MATISFYRQTNPVTTAGALTFDTTGQKIHLGVGNNVAVEFDCSSHQPTFYNMVDFGNYSCSTQVDLFDDLSSASEEIDTISILYQRSGSSHDFSMSSATMQNLTQADFRGWDVDPNSSSTSIYTYSTPFLIINSSGVLQLVVLQMGWRNGIPLVQMVLATSTNTVVTNWQGSITVRGSVKRFI